MTYKILFPILYLGFGYIFSLLRIDIKNHASKLLTRVVIPYVIIHNITMGQQDILLVIAGTILVMAIMFLLGRLISKDPVDILCFLYLNIGWLGLPVAISLFGSEVIPVIIAVYIGSSLFGNTLGTKLLSPTNNITLASHFLSLVKSPPLIALLTGIALIPFSDSLKAIDDYLYEPIKFLMAFLGMAILGMWLAETKIKKDDIYRSIFLSLTRVIILCSLIWVLLYFAKMAEIVSLIHYSQVLYLLCLLPPAANIVILETHYLKTGHSASIIAIGTCISIILIGSYFILLRFIS